MFQRFKKGKRLVLIKIDLSFINNYVSKPPSYFNSFYNVHIKYIGN